MLKKRKLESLTCRKGARARGREGGRAKWKNKNQKRTKPADEMEKETGGGVGLFLGRLFWGGQGQAVDALHILGGVHNGRGRGGDDDVDVCRVVVIVVVVVNGLCGRRWLWSGGGWFGRSSPHVGRCFWHCCSATGRRRQNQRSTRRSSSVVSVSQPPSSPLSCRHHGPYSLWKTAQNSMQVKKKQETRNRTEQNRTPSVLSRRVDFPFGKRLLFFMLLVGFTGEVVLLWWICHPCSPSFCTSGMDSTVVYTVPCVKLDVTLSAVKYTTFLFCGIASLWPWNCFLSASDYFQDKLISKPVLSNNYSSTMMTIFTLTSAIFNFYLSRNQQKGVDYLNRLKLGNWLQITIFAILTSSVLIIPNNESWTLFYFVFIMFNVLATSIGSCLTQVGIMALCNVQKSTIFANATVVGNAIAGVLPSIAMIIAVVSNPMIQIYGKVDTKDSIPIDRSNEAIKYFITSILMALFAQLTIWIMEYSEKRAYLELPNDEQSTSDSESLSEPNNETEEEFVGFKKLWSKLKYVESTIILTFAVTLVFPVFAASVESNSSISKKLYVPVAFLVWNIGDLVGRLLCAISIFQIINEKLLISYSILRLGFIPSFLLCNINGKGGKLGDVAYMLLQLLFGITNGQLFSSSYMRVGGLLDYEAEKKAAAAFTALLINLSLLVGSLGSFLVVYLWIS